MSIHVSERPSQILFRFDTPELHWYRSSITTLVCRLCYPGRYCTHCHLCAKDSFALLLHIREGTSSDAELRSS